MQKYDDCHAVRELWIAVFGCDSTIVYQQSTLCACQISLIAAIMPGPDHAASDDSIEPYYVAKVTRDDPRPVEVNSADRTVPPLPCTFESITPALVTGVLGYLLGAGTTRILICCELSFTRSD